MAKNQEKWNSMKKWIKENQKSLIVALIVLFAVLVTQSILKQVFDNNILQYLSLVANNSLLVQISLVVLIGLIYVYSYIKYSRLYDESKIVPSRIIWKTLLLIFYIYFRLTYHSDYVFYGLDCLGIICYTDVCFILVVIVEFILGIMRQGKNNAAKSKDEQNINCQSFLSDIPTSKDLMNRGDHVTGLLNKIIVSYNNGLTKNHSFTILLNEKYGAGKTTFMLNLKGQIQSNEAYVIDFKPWLCPDSQQMATELLNQFVENKIPVKERLFTKYAQALANESSWIGVVSRFILNSTSTSLSKHFDDIAEDMRSLKKPVIVLVDDVDRLSEDELMELLKLIRNTAAFPNVFYIVAADKGYLSSTLENKGIKEPEIFLQKFFNFEMTFPKDDFCLEGVIKAEISKIIEDENIVTEFISKKCVKDTMQTIRDVYRYCNMLSFEMDQLKRNDTIAEINMLDLMLLTLIRYMNNSIYKVLRDNDAYVLRAKVERLTLNENFKDVINKQYADVVENIAAQSVGANPPIRKGCESFLEAIDQSIPSLEDKVAFILEELFPDVATSNEYSISKVSNYFRYFAGRIASDEMMGAEVYEMIELPHDEFENKFNQICTENKFESFKLKLNDYFTNKGLHSLSVLQNLACVWTYMKFTSENPRGLFKSSDLFLYDMRFLILSVFSQKANGQNDSCQKIVDEWFKIERNLEFLVLTLYTLRDIPVVDARMIISNEQARTYSEIVIKRFIDEQMSGNPFEENIFEQYYNLGLLSWSSQLKDYINSLPVDQRNEWVWRVIYKDDKNNWQWNKKLIFAINSNKGVGLKSYFAHLGIKFKDELEQVITYINMDAPTETQFVNPMMKYIRQLYEENNPL